ncbi:MAG TPA: hypothetical protein VLH18_01405 [Candidatus Limnocylindrales bacterium]|nr:hypothetical protein [Candidatus Limnocylindrales bacterium]
MKLFAINKLEPLQNRYPREKGCGHFSLASIVRPDNQPHPFRPMVSAIIKRENAESIIVGPVFHIAVNKICLAREVGHKFAARLVVNYCLCVPLFQGADAVM